MNRWRSITLPLSFAVLGVVLGVTPGCEGISGPSEREKKIAAEQAIIKSYSEEVPKADALLKQFLDAWKIANEKKDLKTYKDDLETNVLPALDRFLTAASAMPAASEELKAIHVPLIAAYKAAQATLANFTKVVTEATMDGEYAKVLGAMDEVKKAEETYLQKLQAYYKTYRVDLQQGP